MRPIFIFGLLLALFTSLNATSIFDLIETNGDARQLTIELPMDSIYAKSNNKQDAVLTFTDDTGLDQRWPLHVDVRGKFRRRICTLPPLKLDFDKGQLEASGLARHDKLKLVIPCQEGDDYQSIVLREYMAYQLYAEMTPYHFRTQLVELTLVDANGSLPTRKIIGFILEDTDEMAERLGGEEVDDLLGQPESAWDRQAEVAQSMAQFLIGNHDYSLSMVRNLKQVRLSNSGLLVPVAYDFDFSQIVSAPYATINSSVGQSTFSDRIYLGYIASDSDLGMAIERLKSKRKNLVSIVKEAKWLTYGDRYDILNKINTAFYEFRRATRHNEDESIYALLSRKHNGTTPARSVQGLGRK
ncbi:MAG: hypothetical protein AAF741_02500 [Bacteroidota bacterium]